MKEKKNIIVTGASGFVGSSVVEEFEKYEKFQVIGFTGKRSSQKVSALKARKNFFSCDISDLNSYPWNQNLNRTEILVHAAGLAHQFGVSSRESFWRVNVQGTKNVCQFAHKIGVKHLVLLSSVAVYGNYGGNKIDESFSCKPVGFYAESKLESENAAVDFCERHTIPLTILRLATVGGEGDKGNIARLITLIDKNRFIWIGDGKNKKSLIYKKDVAEAVLNVVKNKAEAGTEVFNLTYEPIPMQKIVETIAQQLNKNIPKFKVSDQIVRLFFRFNNKTLALKTLKNIENSIQKWLSDDIFSGDRFSERFKYKPRTTVEEMLRRQVNYYLNQK